MTRRILFAGLGVAAVIGGVVLGLVIWLLVSSGSGEASQPISAPPLSLTQATVTPEPTPAPRPTPLGTPATPRTITRSATAEAPATPAPTTIAPGTATAGAPTGRVLYRVVPEESVVRFEVGEILRGQPNTAVATTNQIAADLIIDFDQPAASEVGTVRVNVRTLRTDAGRRDRAIRSFILESARDEYEFVEFAPTELRGLPSTVRIGEPISFEIAGVLTIRDISMPAVFAARVTVVDSGRVEATATTSVRRDDFNLRVPNVPFVASVDDDVVLGIDFVAIAVDE